MILKKSLEKNSTEDCRPGVGTHPRICDAAELENFVSKFKIEAMTIIKYNKTLELKTRIVPVHKVHR